MKNLFLTLVIGLASLSSGANTDFYYNQNDKGGLDLRLQIAGEDAKEMMTELKRSFASIEY